MKKNSFVFMLFAMFFAVSCNFKIEIENPLGANSDSYDGLINDFLHDADNLPSDFDYNDYINPVDQETSEITDEEDVDIVPGTDVDPGDDTDNINTTPEECAEAGGTWDGETESCTKIAACAEKPANSVWNGDPTYVMTYTDGKWSDEIATKYNSATPGSCRYVCDTNYFPNDSGGCVNPCDDNPCGSDSSECLAHSWKDYICDSTGSSLPECGKSDLTPCYDSKSKLTWSEKTQFAMSHSEALNHCATHSEGGLSGWHVPKIGELRTLVLACPNMEMPNGNCTVKDGCLNPLDCSSNNCDPCSADANGGHNKFGNTDIFWSQEKVLMISGNSVWVINFNNAQLSLMSETNATYYVRCVR